MKRRRSNLLLFLLALLLAVTTLSIARFTALALDAGEVDAGARVETGLAAVLTALGNSEQTLIANDDPPTCYELSVTHEGSGTDPVATPALSSPECDTQGTGFYLPGTEITLTGAAPDLHWEITSWQGTANDASTSTTNTLTMPSNSTVVAVVYERICFALTTGVLPANSGTIERSPLPGQSGCTGGKYLEGTVVSLTAKPATGYLFKNWSGANISTTNPITIEMNGDRAVTANFARACYKLVLTHTGSGDDPVASPISSDACSTGSYYYGAEVSLTASPAPGWQVDSWSGTNNNSSTSINNSLTMPAEEHVASVNYIEKPTLQFAAETYSVNENDGTATIQVSRTGSLKESVSVKYATSNGTAKAGSDYEATSGTLTFARNVQQATFTVPIFNDNIAEGTENLNLALSDVTGGGKLGARTTAVLNILDDEGQPTVQFETTTYSVDEGAGTVPVNVTLFPPTVRSVIVDLKVEAGTATAGLDFTNVSDDIVFRAGDTSAVINVPVNDDALDEPDETIELSLLNVEGAALGADQSTITILDNDDPPPVQFSSNEYFAEAGDDTADVTVVLEEPSGQIVTVEYQIVDVSVGRNLDGVVTLQPGETSQVIQVSIANKKPGDELVLVLENPNNALLGAPVSAKLYVLDPNRSDCYPLTVTVSGYGQPPVASPGRSLSCPAGHYVEGTIITLRAQLERGWYVGRWQGTENDQAKPAPNETVVIMPAGEHEAEATYQTDHFMANVVDFAFFEGPPEEEDNDKRLDANGPIRLGNIYIGSFARKNGGTVRDVRDLYYLYLSEERTLEVLVTGIPQGHNYTLTVYKYPTFIGGCPENDPNGCVFGQSGTAGNRDEVIRKVFPAGHYVVQVYFESGVENESRYQLTAKPQT